MADEITVTGTPFQFDFGFFGFFGFSSFGVGQAGIYNIYSPEPYIPDEILMPSIENAIARYHQSVVKQQALKKKANYVDNHMIGVNDTSMTYDRQKLELSINGNNISLEPIKHHLSVDFDMGQHLQSWHDYTVSYTLGRIDELDKDIIWKNMLEAPAPTDQAEAIKRTGDQTMADKEIPGFLDIGELGLVTHIIDYDDYTIVNATTEDHSLNRGVAALTLEEHNGHYVLVVRGIGNGEDNSGLLEYFYDGKDHFDAIVNERLSKDVWQEVADDILQDSFYETETGVDANTGLSLENGRLQELIAPQAPIAPPPPPAPFIDPISYIDIEFGYFDIGGFF